MQGPIVDVSKIDPKYLTTLNGPKRMPENKHLEMNYSLKNSKLNFSQCLAETI